MAEAKNNFLKAKMNQDLDDRLLPNGEYRTAQNILVGKSEEASVGTLENIKGNELIAATTIADGVYGKMYIIGYLMDSSKDRIYTFLTDWTGDGEAPVDASCSIRFLNVNNTTQYQTLVSGSFLNFSTQSPIIAVNLLEDLLFFTDNRNQPRKINVQTAVNDASHYYKENNISVAKYNPYQPISLIKEEVESVTSVTSTTVFETAVNSNIVAGMTLLGTTTAGVDTILPTEYIKVVSAVTTATETTITINTAPATAISQTDVIYFLASTMTDQSSVTTWPGDPDYLQDKFVRFGYRFKFEDNEYSIFSPFTQIAYIPKQNGYFINSNEKGAFNSTILDWFENGINNIELIVPLPDKANNIASSYKISSVDLLYSESDQSSVKVIDTVLVNEISSSSADNTFYKYSYQSRKPIRTLPQDQTVRVYDKVPVKAKTQEIISNRVVYGNFQTKHTPPDTINYSINIEKKIANPQYTNFIEYPNHTIKQNRNYQVGFVLSDKFGRQSDTILSPVGESTIGISNSRGSTIYAPYIKDDPAGSNIPDPTFMPSGVLNWFGNSIVMLVNSSITGGSGPLAPGLYADQIGVGFDVEKSTTPIITDTTYTFVISTATGAATSIPTVNSYMRGASVDYVEVTGVTGTGTSGDPYVVTTDGRVSNMYLADLTLAASIADTKFAYNENVLGWYSYKIVVKQNEQEYYNVYTAGAMKDVPLNYNVTPPVPPNAASPVTPSTSFMTLINDNINKVPRDLSEVGPQDKTFRSSVRLFGRVENTSNVFSNTGNAQYYPGNRNFTTNTIEDLFDLFDVPAFTQASPPVPITDPANPYHGFFKSESNPFIAEFITSSQTDEQFGLFNEESGGDYQDIENLTILETEPVVSALDIYWETAQAGLISDLNWDVAVGFDGPVAINPTFSFEETDPIGTDLTGGFYPLDKLGSQITTTTATMVASSVRLGVTTDFELISLPGGEYRIQNTVGYEYINNSSTQDVFTFDITFNQAANQPTTWGTQTLSFTGGLTNNTPSFSVASPPYYYYNDTYVADQVIHDFGTQPDSVNGANAATTQKLDLRWTIIAGNAAGYFDIDATSGELKLTTAGLASGNNSYPITIRLEDASLNGATPGTGSLHFDQNITVIKGYALSSSGVDETQTIAGANSYTPPAGGTKTTDYYCYYLSDSTILDSNLPDFNNSTGGFFDPSSSAVDNGNQNLASAYKIGNKLTTGEFIFSVESAYVQHTSTNTGVIESKMRLNVYHRTSSSGPWVRIADSNNSGGTLTPEMTVNNDAIDSQSFQFSMYFAQDTLGEYAFLIEVDSGVSQAEVFTYEFNPTLRDLHYLGASQTQQVYRYDLFTNSNNGYTSSPVVCSASPPAAPNVNVYADNPFGEYVREFFTASDLVTIYAPPAADRFYPVTADRKELPSPITSIEDARSFGIPPQTQTVMYHSVKLNSNGEKDETLASTYAQSTSASSATTCFNSGPYGRTKNLIV